MIEFKIISGREFKEEEWELRLNVENSLAVTAEDLRSGYSGGVRMYVVTDVWVLGQNERILARYHWTSMSIKTPHKNTRRNFCDLKKKNKTKNNKTKNLTSWVY